MNPAGPRPPAASTRRGRIRVPLSLAGSIAVHGAMAVLVLVLSIRVLVPSAPEPVAITMVFEPTAAAPPPVQPEPPAEPPPPPQSPPAPPAAMAPMEPPPPPPAPSPEPAPLPLPPPPPPRPPIQPPRPRPVLAQPIAPSPPQPPATQETAATSTPTPASAPRQSVISATWRNALAGWLQTHKTYPDEARRRGDEGRATVRFTVDRDGQVLDLQLVSSTGSKPLDAAVEQLLRGAHLPAFPPDMTEAEVTVSLQIRYSLER